MSGLEFWLQALALAACVGVAAYGMVIALDARTIRILRLWWAGVRAWLRGDCERETAAYLRGMEHGYESGRCQALKEAQQREKDLIERAFAQGWNNAVQSLKVQGH